MGGKGGGGGNYYQQPPDTSGYGTPEEAIATLAKEKPLDLSGYQQAINVKKAAADATAPEPIPKPTPGVGGGVGDGIADAILRPPAYWTSPSATLTAAPLNKNRIQVTQT